MSFFSQNSERHSRGRRHRQRRRRRRRSARCNSSSMYGPTSGGYTSGGVQQRGELTSKMPRPTDTHHSHRHHHRGGCHGRTKIWPSSVRLRRDDASDDDRQPFRKWLLLTPWFRARASLSDHSSRDKIDERGASHGSDHDRTDG